VEVYIFGEEEITNKNPFFSPPMSVPSPPFDEPVAGTSPFSIEVLLRLESTKKAHRLGWEVDDFPIQARTAAALFAKLEEENASPTVYNGFADALFHGCLRSDVHCHQLYNDSSIRFLALFVSMDAAHARFLGENYVTEFMTELMTEFDGESVMASAWTLLLALVTATCPAHFYQLIDSELPAAALVVCEKHIFVPKCFVAVTRCPDTDAVTGWAVDHNADAIEACRTSSGKHKEQAAALIQSRIKQGDSGSRTPQSTELAKLKKLFSQNFDGENCECLSCTLKFLANHRLAVKAERNAAALIEEEEREKENTKPMPATQKKKKKKSTVIKRNKTPIWMVDDSPEPVGSTSSTPTTASTPTTSPTPEQEFHDCDIVTPDSIASLPEEVVESFTRQQAEILEEIKKKQRPCDYCLEDTFDHMLVACKTCVAKTVCRTCVKGLKEVGAQCSRCHADL